MVALKHFSFFHVMHEISKAASEPSLHSEEVHCWIINPSIMLCTAISRWMEMYWNDKHTLLKGSIPNTEAAYWKTSNVQWCKHSNVKAPLQVTICPDSVLYLCCIRRRVMLTINSMVPHPVMTSNFALVSIFRSWIILCSPNKFIHFATIRLPCSITSQQDMLYTNNLQSWEARKLQHSDFCLWVCFMFLGTAVQYLAFLHQCSSYAWMYMCKCVILMRWVWSLRHDCPGQLALAYRFYQHVCVCSSSYYLYY